LSPDNRSKVDEILDRVRNHRWLSLLVVAGIIVIGLGAVTNAIESIRDFVFGATGESELASPIEGPHPGGTGTPPESIAEIALKLLSDDPLIRRAAVLALKGRPDETISLLITSPVLGAVDEGQTREDTAFTSIVRETLVAAGPAAATPLVVEWRRTRGELRSRFESFPEKTRDDLLRFLRRELTLTESIGAESLTRRATQWGVVSGSDTGILRELEKKDTVELVSARRNIMRTLAELVRIHRIENLDLSQLTIRGDFSEAKLPGANLSDSDLDSVDLSGSDLSRANLSRARLNNTILSDADLSDTDLSRIGIADGADFSRANLRGANFSRSRAIDAEFEASSLRQADFSETVLNRSDFSGADFTGSRLTNALLRGANLANVLGFEQIADMNVTNMRGSTGLSAEQKQDTVARGAVWDDTVGVTLKRLPAGTDFPGAVADRIRFQADSSTLIWSGGRMDREAYQALRGHFERDGASGNSIFWLQRLSFYLDNF
jgi:uncharacterized protein YjbI with pentapeptide repeats